MKQGTLSSSIWLLFLVFALLATILVALILMARPGARLPPLGPPTNIELQGIAVPL